MIVPHPGSRSSRMRRFVEARSGTCRRSPNAGCPDSGQRRWIAGSMRNCYRPFSAVSLEASTPSAFSDLAVCSSPTLQIQQRRLPHQGNNGGRRLVYLRPLSRRTEYLQYSMEQQGCLRRFLLIAARAALILWVNLCGNACRILV